MTEYHRSLVESHPDFRRQRLGTALKGVTNRPGWSKHLAERLLRVGATEDEIAAWARAGSPAPIDLDRWVSRRELTVDTTLNVRLATWNDANLVAELAADSPEQVGDWEVTVERSPDPFGPLGLQQDAYIVLVEDLGFGLGMVLRSTRDTLVDGRRTTVHFASGARIRRGFRGLGLSELLMEGAGPACGRLGRWAYWYVRQDNSDEEWSRRFVESTRTSVAAGVLAQVTTLIRPTEGGASHQVRRAEASDLGRCCELINRVNRDRDFFLPWTVERLRSRLDANRGGPDVDLRSAEYGWGDFLVWNDVDGEVRACGGFWDRGRNVRERWHHPETGSDRLVNPAAVIDLGWAAGSEGAARELIGHLLAKADERGRSGLLVAVDDQPEAGLLLSGFTGRTETRRLMTNDPDERSTLPRRPLVDLVYW